MDPCSIYYSNIFLEYQSRHKIVIYIYIYISDSVYQLPRFLVEKDSLNINVMSSRICLVHVSKCISVLSGFISKRSFGISKGTYNKQPLGNMS